MKHVKTPLTVYWAPLTSPDRRTLLNLLWEPPKKMFKTLPSRSEYLQTQSSTVKGDYYSCKASQLLFSNTFVITHPTTSTVIFEGNHEDPSLSVNEQGLWITRPSHFEDMYAAEYDMGWIFFCEESLEMRLYPPYFHKTETSKQGCIMPGGFDIGQWFRGAMLTHQLWKGQKELTVHKDEPAAYVEFITDRPIVLQQFELVPELWQISLEATNFKQILPNQSLSSLYARFTRSGRRNRVLSLIKENLV